MEDPDNSDLIFIDGSHAYSYVKSDTQKALRMVINATSMPIKPATGVAMAERKVVSIIDSKPRLKAMA